MSGGVIVTPLRIIADARGAVMHMLRADAPQFAGFGEIYFSIVNPGAVKAWKRHREMTLSLCCVSGAIRLVVADVDAGMIREITIGPDRPETYALVTVPPGLWTGFTCMGAAPAILANCASIPHDPAEADTLPADTDRIPYSWALPAQ
ncbi:dTDP-4-dehydrorhamnose 3,5-epimerase [Thalassospiraceae bacterium LMO-SO8]|nr:dTDP-4-dehydrorhamnose 3,5-epimerase [Alphaproteobacteria bacterium LMO-S08]WND77630.1 dTDP-4-dehydrorhamnose 3,5-epimerase [Thalassospiraceae bacterium LMO-SO8]